MKKTNIPQECIVRKTGELYYLSDTILNQRNVVRPTVPDMDDGDGALPRVCLSTSLSGAFRAIGDDDDMKRQYVYIVTNKDELLGKDAIIHPSEEMAHDSDKNEYWALANIRVKYMGLAEFRYVCSRTGNGRKWKPNIVIHWIEKHS